MAETDEQSYGMTLTRSFRTLVQGRIKSDPEFGAALLHEGIDVMLSGEVDDEVSSDTAERIG